MNVLKREVNFKGFFKSRNIEKSVHFTLNYTGVHVTSEFYPIPSRRIFKFCHGIFRRPYDRVSAIALFGLSTDPIAIFAT